MVVTTMSFLAGRAMWLMVSDVAGVSGIRALSGKPVGSLTVEAVRAGEVGLADLRIHPETLERQAVIARSTGTRSWRTTCAGPPS